MLIAKRIGKRDVMFNSFILRKKFCFENIKDNNETGKNPGSITQHVKTSNLEALKLKCITHNYSC